jgi:ADP-ribosyl-[dinitrogen reductase] hydrolase
MPHAVRTSDSHPLQINYLTSRYFSGRIGMTFCPGKKQPYAMTGAWNRDLEQDLKAIVGSGASTLITLMEAAELDELGVADMGTRAEGVGLAWYLLPIPDGEAPGEPFHTQWKASGKKVRRALRDGESIVIHCKGGLGRTGTLAAQLLIEQGDTAGNAMAEVRAVRPGAIETMDQENYLRWYLLTIKV